MAVGGILRRELADRGLQPDPLHVNLVGSRIADRGFIEFERLAPVIDINAQASAICAYHLGIGASFTEFLIRGQSLARGFKSEIATLGGIAHTIFALYDSLLDVSQAAPELFAGKVEFSPDLKIRERQELLVALLDLYFQKLDSLSKDAPLVQALIKRALHKLYQAERQSAEPAETRWHVWWRKNALPIVVMGLPAWLSGCEKSNIKFAEYILWLGRVGEFLGWLDDFSDYERDIASGQTNRLKNESRDLIEAQACKAAVKVQRILACWDSHNDISPERDTFTVIVWMWLKAPQAT